jgi:hypothetical protein
MRRGMESNGIEFRDRTNTREASSEGEKAQGPREATRLN